MTDFLNVVFTVLLLLLVASGLAVIFGLMGIINFAHGEFLMLGAFVAYWAGRHGNFWLGLLLAPLAVGALSLLIEAGLIRTLYRRPLESILATWGLSIVIREGMRLIVGPQFRSIPAPLQRTVSVLGATYPSYRLVAMGIIIALFVAFAALMQFTRLGVVTRAVIENPDLAAGLGVNVSRTYRASFALGSALAGIAGALVAPLVAIHPAMGPNFIVNGFLAVIVGGPGSFAGVGASSALLGTSQSLVSRYVSPVTGSLVILVLAVALMRIRPLGLLRKSA